jgi:ubiquinone biosynthesis protein UbiJ
MSDDTVRTRIIRRWLPEWRKWLPPVVGGIIAVLGVAVGLGRKQEHVVNMESNYTRDQEGTHERLERIESKLDKLAELPAKVEDLNGRMGRMESNWDTAYDQAGKGIQSHRAQRKH